MGNAMIAKRIQVFGRVQGVGFRWFTCREAQRLGIVGWVRNLRDGSVEIHAQGPESLVDALQDWAGKGPPHARVEKLQANPCQIEDVTGFTARETD